MKIRGVIAPTQDERHDVVDFQSIIAAAGCAKTFLLFEENRDIVEGKKPTVIKSSCAPIISVHSAERSRQLKIFFSPSLIGVSDFSFILFRPFERCFAMFCRIFGASFACSCGFDAGMASQMPLHDFKRASDANSGRDVAANEMSVLTWFAGCVEFFVAGARRCAIRMFSTLCLTSQRVESCACSADACASVSLRQMPVFARLSGIVVSLAGKFRGSAFRNWSTQFSPLRVIQLDSYVTGFMEGQLS